MPDTILDQFGSPAVYSGGSYQGPRDEYGLRVPRPTMFGDWAQLLSRHRWAEAVGDCRWIMSSFGLVAGACDQKADYVCASGLRPMFEGDDDAYGDEVEDAIEQADRVACVRGPRFPTKEVFRLVCKALMSDGSAFIVPTQSEDGFPQMQMIEAHRVGQRKDEETTVSKGRFKGARINNGIIYNRAGNEIGFRVLGAAQDGSEDEELDYTQMWHIARPRAISEGRPLPEIAPAILDLWDIREARESAKMQLIIDGKLTLIESNQTGRPDPTRNIVNPPPGMYAQSPSGAQTEVLEKGAIRYIKNGNSLTAHQTSRPSDQFQRYDARIVQTALYAMGWRSEMLDLSSLGGSTTRAFQDQINTAIYSSFGSLLPYIVRWRQYQVAKLTKYGWLKEHPEWYKIGCTPPPEFTCDPSRSVTADMDAVRAGFEAMPHVHGRYGLTSKQVLRSQTRYLKQRSAAAAKAGVNEWELGTLSKPGDVMPMDSSATSNNSAE